MEICHEIINDKYRIKEPLGEGATAKIYRAEEITTCRPVALKMYKPDHLTQDQMHEAEMLGKITGCPKTIQLIEFSPYDQTPYLATTYHDGDTLKKDLISSGRMRPFQAAQLLSDITTGIEAVHQREVVHSDIRPENIIVDTYTHPTIIDFGYAANVTRGHTIYRGGIFGTPEYAPPEQISGLCGPLVDVYSTGVLGYEVFTGQNPFSRTSYELSAQCQFTLNPPSFESLLGNDMEKSLDPFEGVIQKAVAKDPRRRYADMGAFHDALEEGVIKSLQIAAKDMVIIG